MRDFISGKVVDVKFFSLIRLSDMKDISPTASLGPEYRMYADLLEREERAWAQLRKALDEQSFVPTVDGPIH